MRTKKTFGKYEVALELYEEDGEPRSNCWITNTKTWASSSLAKAVGEGTLTRSDYQEEEIDNKVLEQIENWALKRGY